MSNGQVNDGQTRSVQRVSCLEFYEEWASGWLGMTRLLALEQVVAALRGANYFVEELPCFTIITARRSEVDPHGEFRCSIGVECDGFAVSVFNGGELLTMVSYSTPGLVDAVLSLVRRNFSEQDAVRLLSMASREDMVVLAAMAFGR